MVSNWVSRGCWSDVLGRPVYLPVAKREGRTILFDPVEVSEAEYASRKRAPGCVMAHAAAYPVGRQPCTASAVLW